MSLSEIDLDLLADYAEGLLDGDQAAQVAAKIESDGEWALTYQLLTRSGSQVDQALAGYAQITPPLPADVSARIDAVLHDEREAAAADLRTPISLEAARNRRISRRSWVGLSAAAAVVIAVVFGLGVVGLNLGGSAKSPASTAARPNSGAGGASFESLAGVAITSSGTDYSPTSLGGTVVRPHALSTLGESTSPDSPPRLDQAPSQLRRLSAPSALAACVNAVTAGHGGTTTAVDYARYQGQPALIISLSDPALRVAVGSRCGLPNYGTDELATATPR